MFLRLLSIIVCTHLLGSSLFAQTAKRSESTESTTKKKNRVVSLKSCPCIRPYLLRNRNGLLWKNTHIKQQNRLKKMQLKYLDAQRTPVTLQELNSSTFMSADDLKHEVSISGNHHQLYQISDQPIKFNRVGLFYGEAKNARETERLGQQTTVNVTPRSMWLGKMQTRQIRGCGTVQTYPLHFEKNASGILPDAVWIEATDSKGTIKSALFDVKYLRLYGISNIPVCGHGLPASASWTQLKITPLDALQKKQLGSLLFIKNQLGNWLINGKTMQIEPEALKRRTPLIDFDRSKNLLVLFFILLIASIFAGAWFWKNIAKKKSKKIVIVECVDCKHQIKLNIHNPKEDGKLCPSCKNIHFYFKEKALGETEIIMLRKNTGRT